MIWLFKNFWRSLGFAGTLIFLLFLPSDVNDLPEALAGWRDLLAYIDRTTALAIFSILALGYIIWIDARPMISQWKHKKRSAITVSDQVQWKAKPFEVDEEQYYKNFCYILVFNQNYKRKTAKSVRVRLYTAGDPREATTLSGKTEVDIHHGEVEWFEIGSLISTRMYGFVTVDGEVFDADRKMATKGVSHGSLTFMTGLKSGIGLHYNGVSEDAYSANPLSFVTVRVSASDAPTIEVTLELNRKALLEKGPEMVSPIEIAEVNQL